MNVDTRNDGSIVKSSCATARASASLPESANDAASIRRPAINRGFARLHFRNHAIASSYLPATTEIGQRQSTQAPGERQILIERQRPIKEFNRLRRFSPQKGKDVAADGKHKRILAVEFDGALRNSQSTGPIGIWIFRPALTDPEIEPPREIGIGLRIGRIERDGSLEQFTRSL